MFKTPIFGATNVKTRDFLFFDYNFVRTGRWECSILHMGSRDLFWTPQSQVPILTFIFVYLG